MHHGGKIMITIYNSYYYYYYYFFFSLSLLALQPIVGLYFAAL
jgi:hypothetical protein